MTAGPDKQKLASEDGRLEGAIIVLTERCNSRCGMCEYWKSEPARSLAEAEVRDFWERRVKQRPGFVTLSGGEPLLYPELFSLAEYFRPRTDNLVISTNGLLLGDHYQAVADHFDKVIVSLDGSTPETYKRVRGVDGFDSVTGAARAQKRYSENTRLILKLTLQKANFRELDDWIELAIGLGADAVALTAPDLTSDAFFKPGTDRSDLASRLLLDKAEALEFSRLANKVLEKYRDAIQRGFIIEGNLERYADFFARAAARPGPAKDAPGRDCQMARRRLIINADGAVRPCFFLPALGHISDPGTDDVFDSGAFREFRLGFSSQASSVCGECLQFMDWRFE